MRKVLVMAGSPAKVRTLGVNFLTQEMLLKYSQICWKALVFYNLGNLELSDFILI